ncbi:hypothetical protein ANN_20796 [Periplaneta americana]|uniref:Uncharacterized protein n=1 Tax=Periplaneta americana TaxID=6978 RepID=A0ABQ8SEQ2_PERAM|nr:hypothetical protein ANN_20796 [Periplaneta americana]
MPSTWPGIEPAILGIEGQRYTNSPTRSTTVLRWAGHLIRKEEAEIPKREMLTQPDGTRRKGRPRSRWIDGVDGDARALGTESYPAFARIGLSENPGKNLNQVTCPDRDSNPGHLVLQPDALTVTPQERSQEKEKLTGQPPFTEQKLLQSTVSIQKAGSQ